MKIDNRIDSNLVNLHKIRDEKVNEINLLKSEIFKINQKLKINELDNNINLYDNINKLLDAYNGKDHNLVRNLLQSVRAFYDTDILVDLDATPIDQIESAKNYGGPMNLPKNWGLDIQIQRGGLFILGAKSGIGKTTAACNIVYDAIENGKSVLLYSIEQPPRDIWNKLYRIYMKLAHNCSYSHYEVEDWMRSPNLHKSNYTALREWCLYHSNKLKIVESNGFSASSIISVYDQMVDRIGDNPDWCIIDYFQLIKPEDSTKNLSRREQSNDTSEILRLKSKNTNSSFCILSQLNADGEYRESSKIKDDTSTGIVLERSIDKETGEYTPHMKIVVTKGRHTGGGSSWTNFDGKTGAMGCAMI